MNELRELIDLITENGLTSFELEREGFRVKVGRGTFVEDQGNLPPVVPGGTEKQLAAGAGAPMVTAQSIPTSPSHPGAQAEPVALEHLGPVTVAREHRADPPAVEVAE